MPFSPLVRVEGLEPSRSCPLRILSPVRLPFRHTRICHIISTSSLCFLIVLMHRTLSPVRLPLYPKNDKHFRGPHFYPKNFVKFSGTPSATLAEKLFLGPNQVVDWEVVQFFSKKNLEVPPGFEPGNEGFADLCLTTWLWYQTNWNINKIA